MPPAHSNKNLAELVCSNSLKSSDIATAGGLLKAELRLLGSLCMEAADKCKVAAGGALAVDRALFSEAVTKVIFNHPNIEFTTCQVEGFDESAPTIIAAGPLVMEPLLSALQQKLGTALNFYDAAAPIISADSIDYESAFFQSRYDKGDGEYINCPLNKIEYEEFLRELVSAKTVILRDFEKGEVFEGCMPVEVMARRGADTLRFGPLKPVGLRDKDGKRPYAVVQLRREDAMGQMYNMVGFQTNLTFPEQKRVFGLIPALKNAEFLRFGVMHRNSFVNAPVCLNTGFSTKKFSNIFIAGQLSGVEGYCESMASGIVAALNMYALLKNMDCESNRDIKSKNDTAFIPPAETMIGALTRYITAENKNFQPMNANFGLLPAMDIRDKKARKEAIAHRALAAMENYLLLFGI